MESRKSDSLCKEIVISEATHGNCAFYPSFLAVALSATLNQINNKYTNETDLAMGIIALSIIRAKLVNDCVCFHSAVTT